MDQTSSQRGSRKRSWSPYRGNLNEDESKDVKRQRSRSPHRHKHRQTKKESLPFRGQHLHKHDLETYKALFAEYLDLQKELDIADLDDHEVKGRWKSFLGRWNRGELSEGWYDPKTKERADERAQHNSIRAPLPLVSQKPPAIKQRRTSSALAQDARNDDDDDDYGPTLPTDGQVRGPTLPNFEDLQYKRELAEEDRDARVAELRYERTQDRKTQKERLEDLVPRAAAGTRERQLEKKKDTALSNRAFAETKDAGVEEVPESELLGDDGVDVFKAEKRKKERQKNERELRKEEILRAREVEREERLAEHRKKEDKTMEYLRSLAQQRYGGAIE